MWRVEPTSEIAEGTSLASRASTINGRFIVDPLLPCSVRVWEGIAGRPARRGRGTPDIRPAPPRPNGRVRLFRPFRGEERGEAIGTRRKRGHSRLSDNLECPPFGMRPVGAVAEFK